MLRMLLVRHGESMGNVDRKFSGYTDDELSTLGKEQAKKVAARLREEKIAAVYASDLTRAYDTAAAIAAEHGLPVEKIPGLREINFGDWDGVLAAEITAKWGEELARWREDPLLVRAPGGETYTEVKERFLTALESIAARHQDGTVAVVTHGGPIAALYCGLLQKRFYECAVPNTAVCELEFGPEGVKAVSHGDARHLEG
ncbi:MAG: histidine phosphatase family protein [bacterium]|jgi:broad specificity phosphatase PhoE